MGRRHHPQKLSEGGWKSNQGGSSVQDNTSVVKLGCCVTESDGIKINFPVCLASQWNFGHFASIVTLVHATEHSLRLVALTIISVTEIERYDRFVKKALINHVVEGWNNLVDADGIVAETQYAVETTKSKSQARLLSSFSKILMLDFNIANLDRILGDEAG